MTAKSRLFSVKAAKRISFTIEDELRLSRELAFAIAEADDEAAALGTALARVCCATGWQMGQAWTPGVGGLRCSSSWYCEEGVCASVREFRRLSETLVLPFGVGLPGLVWQEGHSEWVRGNPDEACDPHFLRAEMAKKVGLKVALAVPVSAGHDIVAVLEFFSLQEREEDTRLLHLVSAVAVQLGSLLLRKRAEQSLRESEAELQALIRAIDDLVIVLDADGRYLRIAPTNNTLLYRPAVEMLGRTVTEVLPLDEATRFLKVIGVALETRRTAHIEYSLLIEGETLWFSANISPMNSNQVVWVARDITNRKNAETQLAQAEQNYRGIFEHAVEGIFQTDLNGKYLSANPALARIYGYESVEEMMGSLTDIGRQLYHEGERRDEFARLLARHDMVSKFESQVRRKDGALIWISENARAVRDQNGELLYYEGTVEDISERKWQETQLEEQQLRLREINLQLQALATLDGLTGLKNHRALQDALSIECERAARDNRPLSLLLLDVDKFKTYNDSFGHPAGDLVLKTVARILQDNAREGDFVARYGGEEFAILLPHANAAGALLSAERFRLSLEKAPWPDRVVTASFGVATYDPPANTGEAPRTHDEWLSQNARHISLVTEADKALYWSKTSGRNRSTHVNDLPK